MGVRWMLAVFNPRRCLILGHREPRYITGIETHRGFALVKIEPAYPARGSCPSIEIASSLRSSQ